MTTRLLWQQRALIWVLVSRDLNARYRASVLGFLWSLANPLLLLAVYSFVFTQVFQPKVAELGMEPYPLFLFTGLLPWLFFSGALMDSASTLVDNGPLMAKVVCPPEIFPVVTVVSHLIHHLLAFPVLLAALGVAHAIGWHSFPKMIFLVPVVLVPWIVATAGLAFAVSALAVHFRDLRDLLGHLLNLLFFSSPIIYSLAALELDWLRRVLSFNPLACLLDIYRGAVFESGGAASLAWLASTATAIVCWWIGTAIFSRMRDTIVEAA